MRWAFLVVGLGVLAGCGVDGAPEKPEPRASSQPAPRINVEVSGTAEVGVVGSF